MGRIDFEPFEHAITKPTPACIRNFYDNFDLKNCPGEFYDISSLRFDSIDRLQVQYFNLVSDVRNFQSQAEAFYFRFAASPDETDWWLRIDPSNQWVTICSTYVDGRNPLRDLECFPLTLDELLACPYRRL